METFKVCLVGDARVGKTSLVDCLRGKDMPHIYKPTLGVSVFPVIHNGRKFNIWDTAGQERFGGLRTGYYLASDIGLVVYNNVPLLSQHNWIEDFVGICPNIPIVKCVNLFDPSIEPTQFNQPAANLFFINVSQNEGLDTLMDHLCNVATNPN